MPTSQDIMTKIQEGLSKLPSGAGDRPRRTKAVKAELCRIGRNEFHNTRFKVCADLPDNCRDYGEWLYDVTWLRYHEELADHQFVACLWSRSANGVIMGTSKRTSRSSFWHGRPSA